MFFATLLFCCCALLVVYNWCLSRSVRLLEHQAAWASLDKQAWMRFLLSGQAPVIEPCNGFSKLVEALWAGYISQRVTAQMRTTLEQAIAQLPAKCVPRRCSCACCGLLDLLQYRVLAAAFQCALADLGTASRWASSSWAGRRPPR